MLGLSVSANNIKRIKIGEIYICSITLFLLTVVFCNLCVIINCSYVNILMMRSIHIYIVSFIGRQDMNGGNILS